MVTGIRLAMVIKVSDSLSQMYTELKINAATPFTQLSFNAVAH